MRIKDPFEQQITLFRAWKQSQHPKSDPEVIRLEEEAQETRLKLKELRAKGKQRRMNRLQELDALDMRRVTLTEILKRLETELTEKDVYSYGKILAEVYGQRTIFAHSAIGMEALLCQSMHQMLAKQHQLKIVKSSAKTIHRIYSQHTLRNKDEFHLYGALAVQLETARLSLLAMYDDIFAKQHRALAILKGSNTTEYAASYSIPTSTRRSTKPTLVVSTKHQVTATDLASPNSISWDHDDYHAAIDILDDVSLGSSRKISNRSFRSPRNKTPLISRPPNRILLQTEKMDPKSITRAFSAKKLSTTKSARERRREIENMRQSGIVGISLPKKIPGMSRHSIVATEETPDATSHRKRMRELEAARNKLASPRSSPPILEIETKKKEFPKPREVKNATSPIKPIRVLKFGNEEAKTASKLNAKEESDDSNDLKPRRARARLRSPRKQYDMDNCKKENRPLQATN
jgi:hypothetical protein